MERGRWLLVRLLGTMETRLKRKKSRRKRKKTMRVRMTKRRRSMPRVRITLNMWRIWTVSLVRKGDFMILTLRRRTKMRMGLVVSCGMILDWANYLGHAKVVYR